MIGVESREKNGIAIMRLHYSADPEKRSEEWQEEVRRGLSRRDWRREYEIDWHVASGLPVYADEFIRDFHVSKKELLAHEGKPIYRGWDFGLTPACVWCQMDPMGRLNVIAEHVTWDGRGDMKQMGIERFAPAVLLLSNEMFPGASFIDYADPAGWSKAETDEKSCVDIMHGVGIHPRKGPVTFTIRKRAMVERLGMQMGGRAALLVSNECTMMTEGFEGAYRYEQVGETGRYKDTVEKNAWSHPMDALSYVVGGLYAPPKRERDEDERRRVGKPNRVTGY